MSVEDLKELENTLPQDNVDKGTTKVEESKKPTFVEEEERKKLEAQVRAELEAQLKADNEKEIDRRITEAIKTRETKLKREQAEKERIAKLSEEERLKELTAKKEAELQARYRDIVVKELKLELVDILAEEQLPLEMRDLIDVNKYADVEAINRADKLKEDVTKFKSILNNIVNNQVAEAKKEFLRGNTPVSTNTKQTPISEYDKAKKQKDVKGMLSAKLYGTK